MSSKYKLIFSVVRENDYKSSGELFDIKANSKQIIISFDAAKNINDQNEKKAFIQQLIKNALLMVEKEFEAKAFAELNINGDET